MSKEPFLTPREQNLFVDLYDLVFLDVEYLQKVIYRHNGKPSSKPAIYRRTKLLEQNGYISSFRLPIVDKANPSGRSINVYTLDTKGLEEVRELIGDVRWDSRWTDRTPSHIYHCLEMAGIHASFKLIENEKFELHGWLNEARGQYRYADGRDGQVKPDGMLILKAKGRESFAGFMMEIERSKQRKDISIGKLKRYNKYCELKCYLEQESIDVKMAAPRIVFISARENEMKNLMLHTQEVDTSAINDVLYTTIEKIKADPYGRIFYAKGSANPDQLYGIAEPIQK